jgi:cytoskeletal protein CcmA (bactofilin family)
MRVVPYRSAAMIAEFASGARVGRPGLLRTKGKILIDRFAVPEIDPAATEEIPDAWRIAGEPCVSTACQMGISARIEGDIDAQDDLFMDGEVDGYVIAPNHKLYIGPNANVKANIQAKHVVLAGSLEGNIEASDRVELRSKCTLLGDVRSARILIEHGAFIKGAVEVVE